jgi:hypothetical protein
MAGEFIVKSAKNIGFWMIVSLILVAAFSVRAATVNYTSDNIILDNGQRLTGTFSWSYKTGDFEIGTGEFIILDIPGTTHNIEVLNITFDIGKSIEITLDLNLHDDGIDINLVFSPALTPTQSTTLDLVNSKYAIGGNGFNEGVFLGGGISPVILQIPAPAAWWRFGSAPYLAE